MIDKELEVHYRKTLERFGVDPQRVRIRPVLAQDEPTGAEVYADGTVEWRYDHASALDEAVEQSAVIVLGLEIHHQLCGIAAHGEIRHVSAFDRLSGIVIAAWAYRVISDRLGAEKAWSELRSMDMLYEMVGDAMTPLHRGITAMTVAAIRTVLGQTVRFEFPDDEFSTQWGSLWAEVQRLVMLPANPALLTSLPEASRAEYRVTFEGDHFAVKDRA